MGRLKDAHIEARAEIRSNLIDLTNAITAYAKGEIPAIRLMYCMTNCISDFTYHSLRGVINLNAVDERLIEEGE